MDNENYFNSTENEEISKKDFRTLSQKMTQL